MCLLKYWKAKSCYRNGFNELIEARHLSSLRSKEIGIENNKFIKEENTNSNLG
ncbi:2668_t:CDS:2 [Racocetra persica]|uniref:2668_t:CDS:1 n=1 Tax=Racocetra persica TaxID=160502 RepID=A0ACA9KPB6_9GLOM|nr:2668_t:CDS:2 [Racocetra persica]